MTRQQLGIILKAKREKRGITRYQINKQTGLKFDLINSIERGSTNYTIDKLLVYLDAVGFVPMGAREV